MSKYREHRFVICICNDNYPVSLEKRKIYEALPDAQAQGHHQVRVIDESGDDYLYPETYFVPVTLPKETEDALVNAA